MVLNRIGGSSIGVSEQPKKVFLTYHKVMGVFRPRYKTKVSLERRRLTVQS